MHLSDKYHFLEQIGVLPKMVAASLQYLGIKEYPGTNNNNPVIMNMARTIGLSSSIYPSDEVAWCAMYHTFILKITGKPLPAGGGYYYLRAKTYETWGREVKEGEEMLGDTLVFSRSGGAHVGLYIAESANTFHVLGANQSNSVSIMEIAKDRLTSASNYYSIGAPASVKKYLIDSSGKLSINEA